MTEFRPANQVHWAVERTGLLLIHADSGASCLLGYPDAAVWDLLARGNTPEIVASKLCAIAALAPAEAQALVDALTARWHAAGWLSEEAAGG
jgi:hypothetical protein